MKAARPKAPSSAVQTLPSGSGRVEGVGTDCSDLNTNGDRMTNRKTLNGDLNVSEHARQYAEHGYAVLEPFLTAPVATQIYNAALAATDWTLVTVIEGQHREFVSSEMDKVDRGRRAAFDSLVLREARAGFCYLFDRIDLYTQRRRNAIGDAALAEAAELVASEAFLDLGRRLTGDLAIRFADCQLTRFGPGHFLTAHDDSATDKDRSAAFVLNLSQGWCADYGGVLQLLDPQGDVRVGLVPKFNRLSVFRVPQAHAVSVVAPFAPGPRVAITGWFRRDAEPELAH